MGAAPEYAFVTEWRVRGTAQEVFDVLSDPFGLTRWWPSVYLKVEQLGPPEPGTGPLIGLHTKGWLPYTLRWSFRVVESTPPHGFRLVAHGDFEGTGTWALRQVTDADGDSVLVTYDWRIKAEKPLLRYGTFVFRPFFAANHRWAMRQGDRSLKRELERRRAAPSTSSYR